MSSTDKGCMPEPRWSRRTMMRMAALTGLSVFAGRQGVTRASAQSKKQGKEEAAVRAWRHYAKSPYGQVHFRSAEPAKGEAGTDKTPLVCFHQSPTSGDYYREFQQVMAADRLVMCPDTPGYGMSDGPSAAPTMSDYGAAMADALDDLGYGSGGKGPVDTLGFHTGNFVALELALQRPDLVRRMVMPGIPYFPADQREDMLNKYGGPRPYFSDPDFVGRNYRETVIERDTELEPQRLLDLFTDNLLAGVDSWHGFDAVFRYDADTQLAKLEKPVLLPILNETLAEPTRQAASLLQQKEIIELPDLTGWSWFQAPGDIAATVRPFLDKA